MPPRLGWAYNFVRLCLPPTTNGAYPTTTAPPTTDNLSDRPPCFHIRNLCPRPAVSDKDLVPPVKILTATGGHLLFHGRSSAVDSYGSYFSFSVRRPILSLYFRPPLKSLSLYPPPLSIPPNPPLPSPISLWSLPTYLHGPPLFPVLPFLLRTATEDLGHLVMVGQAFLFRSGGRRHCSSWVSGSNICRHPHIHRLQHQNQ